MKKNILTKGLIFAMTMALTISPMSVSATVRDNVGGGTLEGKTWIEEDSTTGTKPATEDQILKDYQAYVNGELLTGTMPNNGSVSKTLNAGGAYTIPKGYHDGTGKITVTNSSTTAGAGDILTGKSVTINGTTTNGTMPNNGSVSKTLNAGGAYTIPKGYHDGTGKITVTNSSTTAGAGDILTGKSVTINGTTTNGTMPNLNGKKVSVGTISENGTNAKIMLNETGRVTNSSYVEVPIETLKNEVSSLNSSTAVVSPCQIHNYSSYQLCDGASNTHLYTFINDYACISINTTHNGTFYSGSQTCIAYLNGIQIYSTDGDNTFYISNIKNGDVLKIYWQSSSRWTPILTISAFL